ncbi:hypothetical protein EC973_005134 [Apophysomyces ossiformis]|uniref:SHSP domain-containing protein n=1 Tax=Apophysomyces ossiformis TaxID=679940 RepID=A0A8H7EM49_9FUNG|nr:hypothetical protein EC973_005134 [Apophysomyces ossiformis]
MFSDAFRDMSRAFAMLDEPLWNAARRSAVAFRYPATDLKETATAYELRAEVPGVKKEDIEIELADNNTLILRGSVQHSSETSSAQQVSQEAGTSVESAEGAAEGAGGEAQGRAVVQASEQTPHWWTNERMRGTFRRSFTFPTSVDAEAIKASCQDGILTITVPKSGKSTTRISID